MGGCLSTNIDPTLRFTKVNRFLQSEISNEQEESNESFKTECENQRNWSELPSLPLEEIYSYVSRKDQFSMSLVCRKWSEGFKSPSVWRTFEFHLKDPQLSQDNCPAVMRFVQKQSCMFRHVTIMGTFVRKKHVMKNVCRHFSKFLQILSKNTQLNSVSFRRFSYCFRLIDVPTYKDICKEIIDFLGSQRHLKRVEFDQCAFGYKESAEILRKLTDHNRETLTQVVLRNFVKTETPSQAQESESNQILPTLEGLPNLTILECNYSTIFEHMVRLQVNEKQTIKICQTRSLTKIILHYYQSGGVEDFRGLTSSDWQFLQEQYPDLQFEFTFRGYSPSQRELEFFIVPNMPISRLQFIDESSLPIVEISALIDHLLACEINDHLVALHLEWGETVEYLYSTFIPFLQACKKLKCLELYLISPTNDMELFLYSLRENPCKSLEKVIIDVSNIDDENVYHWLLNITTEYVPLLKLAGLDIKRWVFLRLKQNLRWGPQIITD